MIQDFLRKCVIRDNLIDTFPVEKQLLMLFLWFVSLLEDGVVNLGPFDFQVGLPLYIGVGAGRDRY